MSSGSDEPSWRRKLVLIFYDESIFHSNDDQGWMWGEKGKTIFKPKGQGRGIIVSDLINEHNGYIAPTDAEYKQGKQTYVTVHAKTSLVRTKIEINFFTPAYSYIH